MILRRIVLIVVAATVGALLAGCTDDSKTPVTATASPRATVTAGPGAYLDDDVPFITIDQQPQGAKVNVPFEISGTADVFEAVLSVAVSSASGTLCERTVQATSGRGTRGTWTATMAFVPPAQAETVTIRAFSRSPKDGAEINVVTRSLQLAPDVPDIAITQPRCAADVPGGASLAVSGSARVFEAALTVELRAASGAVLAARQVTADAGAPAIGNWTTQFDLDGIAAGAYELVAYNLSARDGTPEHVFSIPIRITV
ncbi:MAG: Gmad2 immunoglobulin-like domain-containing protein [Chloroflexota bacterium]|nr:Gmad2 immunoglobulin-like domain-containing protein [Chloroflexota bacterium]